MDDKQPQLNLFETRLKASELRELIASLYKGVSDAPALRRVWRDITGDLVAGQFLEACLDWDARMHDKRDGWWWKDAQSWDEQAGFSEGQTERCRKLLEKAGLICTTKRPKHPSASAHTWHFRVNWAEFWPKFAHVVQRTLDEIRGVVAAIVQFTPGETPGVNPGKPEFEAGETPDLNPANPERKPGESAGDSTLYSSSSSTPLSTSSSAPPAFDARFNAIWEAALGQLEAQLDRNNFHLWLKGARLKAVAGETFVVEVRSPQVAEMCNHRLGKSVTQMVNNAAFIGEMPGGTLMVRFESRTVDMPAKVTPLPKLWKVPQRPMAMAGGAG